METSGKNQRVSVKIYNVSAKPIEITPKNPIRELQDIEVLGNMDLGENVSNCQQQIDEATEQMSQGRKKHMAQPGLEPRTSRIPCEHSDH